MLLKGDFNSSTSPFLTCPRGEGTPKIRGKGS